MEVFGGKKREEVNDVSVVSKLIVIKKGNMQNEPPIFVIYNSM